jgi:diguanylate cyclase (GGDEF)-like protein/PAS domain S-box-containing protein
MRRFAFGLACAAGLLSTAVAVAIIASSPGTDLSAWTDDAGSAVPALLVAPGFCLWAGLKQSRWRRLAWFLLGGSAFLWGVGEVVYTYYDLIGDGRPFPGYADLFFLGSVPLAAAGLLILPGAPRSLADAARQLFDGLLIGGSVLFISLTFALTDLWQSNLGHPLLNTVLGIAYPVSDVVLTSLALLALSRMRGGRLVPVLLTAGLCMLAVADTHFNYAQNMLGSNDADILDLGWYAGYFAIGLAALWAALHPERTAEEAATRGLGISVWQTLTPYLPLAGAASAAMFAAANSDVSRVLVFDGIAVLAFLVVRQLFTLVENIRLNRSLESKVAARTAELAVGKERLEHSERRFRSLVQHSSDVISVIDPGGRITFQAESVTGVLGYAADQLVGKPFLNIVQADDRALLASSMTKTTSEANGYAAIECRLLDHQGRVRYAEVRISNLIEDPAVGGIVLNLRDITERKRLERDLVHQAFHDSITSLPNRALFRDRLEHGLMRRGDRSVGILLLDLDGFKAVNDSLGHVAGDKLLRLVGERLGGAMRPGDTVARLGGDEFAVLVEGLRDEAQVADVAQRLIDVLKPAFTIENRDVVVRASIGIATVVSGTDDADHLLRSADLAMYRAKEHNTGGYEIYQPDLQDAAVRRFDLQSSLQSALDLGQMEVFYQPVIELGSGEAVGAEALVRWRHPEKGMISPVDFIPLAEQSGMIVPLGRWVLRTACAEAQGWRTKLGRDLGVSVNLSARQFRDVNLIADVSSALQDTGLPPNLLTLEVTESVLIDDLDDMIVILEMLRGLGVNLSLDDFGTGYSSFSYLRKIPVDELKIDRSFVSEMGDGQATAVARSIVTLGETLGLEIVAEGIEKADQYELLVGMGCHRGQGFHFSPPKPAPEVLALFERSFAVTADK